MVTKNPDYWQKDAKGNQLPYLDKITFKPVAEAVQRVNSLQGGQLDVIHTSDGQQVDALDLHREPVQRPEAEGRAPRGALLPHERRPSRRSTT